MNRLISAIKTILWLGLAAVLIWFSANNIEPVALSFYPLTLSLSVPPWFILFTGIFIGLAAAGLATSWTRLKGFVARRRLARERRRLSDEVANLSEEVHETAAEKARQQVSSTAVTGITPSKSSARHA